jgi:4-diphosphocytidyl-2-C-methyl-D-erythritol kinase
MIHLRAPAKLNLYLRVLGRRPDGYHEIETLFERVDLADELTFEPQPNGLTLTCTEPTLSCGEDNLVLKAARALQETTGVTLGAHIHLIKRIPVAAGLGGGSSDAAAALLGLNHLWELGLGRERLIELAAALGSDVPFFLSRSPFAIGRGRGEWCEPVADAPSLAHVLVVPEERLSTREVYGGFSPLTDPAPSITMIVHALRNGPDLPGLAKGLWNDLEPEAIRRCPVISRILLLLRELGCLGVCLSGSGPALFGLCGSAAQTQDVVERLRPRAENRWRIEAIQTDGHTSKVSVPSGGE